MENKEEKIEKFVIRVILIIALLIVLIVIFYKSQKSELEIQKERDITETKLFSLESSQIERVGIYSDNNEKAMQIDNKDIIKDLLQSIKQSEYGKPNHPSNTNSDAVKLTISTTSSDIDFTLYLIIMNEGINDEYVFFKVLDEKTNLYKSSDLYKFMVEKDIYNIFDRRFTLD